MAYPDGCDVLVKYPRSKAEEHRDRSAWPWLPGWIVQQCGQDEWEACMIAPELAMLEDGSKSPPDTPEDQLLYPVCFRDSSELRPVPDEEVS